MQELSSGFSAEISKKCKPASLVDIDRAIRQDLWTMNIRRQSLIFGVSTGEVGFGNGITCSTKPLILCVFWICWGSAPDATRTCDLLIRSQLGGVTQKISEYLLVKRFQHLRAELCFWNGPSSAEFCLQSIRFRLQFRLQVTAKESWSWPYSLGHPACL